MEKEVKKSILFLCGHYASPKFANSICVQNLAEEYVKRGCKVWVVGMSDGTKQQIGMKNGVNLFLLPEPFIIRSISKVRPLKGLLLRFIQRLYRICHSIIAFFSYPNVDYPNSSDLFRIALKIISSDQINTVVATYKPYSAIETALKLKKKYPSLRVVTYHLDLLLSPDNSFKIIREYKNFLAKAPLKRELEIVDKMLLPNSAPKISNTKIAYVDFPLYVPSAEVKDEKSVFENETINIAYVGSIDAVNRNPSYIFSLVEKMPKCKGKNVVLHIWGQLSEEIVKGIIDNKKVIYHGMASPETVPNILRSADFLLSIGNKITYNMIPSKIFQIFAAQKPIIFVQKSELDKSLSYYLEYGATCFVNESRQIIDEAVGVVDIYINEYYMRTINVPNSLFEKSTPKFICDCILG